MCLSPSALGLAQSCPFFVAALLVYIVLVRVHRYDRARGLERLFAPYGKASYSNLTTDQAQAILRDLTELEFPKTFGFSIIFALFKVRSSEQVLP